MSVTRDDSKLQLQTCIQHPLQQPSGQLAELRHQPQPQQQLCPCSALTDRLRQQQEACKQSLLLLQHLCRGSSLLFCRPPQQICESSCQSCDCHMARSQTKCMALRPSRHTQGLLVCEWYWAGACTGRQGSVLHEHQHSSSLHVFGITAQLQLAIQAGPTCRRCHGLPCLSTPHVLWGRQHLESTSLLQVLVALLPLLHT